MNNLKVLILNIDLPIFPGRAGHEYLQTTHLAKLAKKVGLVSLAHTHEHYQKKQSLADKGVDLYIWTNPALFDSKVDAESSPDLLRRLIKAFYDLLLSWPCRPRDTVVQDFQFRNISSQLLDALSKESWGVVIVVQSTCAKWIEYLPLFRTSVLVLHDIRSLVYERQSSACRNPLKRLLLWRESWCYRRYERKFCGEYDLVLTVSEADEAWVREHYKPRRVKTIPIPVDSSYFSSMPDISENFARIVFTGMMNHPPNVDAALFFAKDIFPTVRMAIPEAEFWIVGRDPSPQVISLGDLPGIVVTGFVDDIRPHIAQASVVVVPLRFGSGMRNKILEAWAMKKYVISTHIGAEGLDYKDGDNIHIVDEPKAMTERVISAIKDSDLRDRIKKRCRDVVIQKHDPEILAREYFDSIASVVLDKQRQGDPLNAVIDLRWMYPGLAGGIENLSRSFLKCLMQLDTFNKYMLIVPSVVRYDFDVRNHPNFRITTMDGPMSQWRSLLQSGARCLHGLLQLDYRQSPEVNVLRQAHLLNADVALSMPGYIHPDLRSLLNVLVVPDIQHEYCPEFFSHRALEERRRLYTESIVSASHLCAISEFTRQTLIDRLDVEPNRITTTHLAADPIFHTGSKYRGISESVLKKYALHTGEYLFFPGHTWPHKNHRTAIEALAILHNNYHLNPILVCTGNPREAQTDLLSLVKKYGLEKYIKFLGYCPTHEMPSLYENAAALVFPSVFEGFGIPLLEAMWCECPVVCSNTTSLPEIAGNAAVLFDPKSPEGMAEAVSRVLVDSALRTSLIESGKDQIKKFSWKKFTLEITRILYHVRDKS